MDNSSMPNRADLPTGRQLIHSTLIAVATAAAVLMTVILPSEYGLDPTGMGRVLGYARTSDTTTETVQRTDPESVTETVAVSADSIEHGWTDEVSVTLEPGEAAEVKLVMIAGGVASYEWSTDTGYLNSDMHAEGTDGETISYRRGRAEFSDSGNLEAAFDGNHGWYWRNRSNDTVTITLRARGDYTEIKRVL